MWKTEIKSNTGSILFIIKKLISLRFRILYVNVFDDFSLGLNIQEGVVCVAFLKENFVSSGKLVKIRFHGKILQRDNIYPSISIMKQK